MTFTDEALVPAQAATADGPEQAGPPATAPPRRAATQARVPQAFSQIVAVLMRDPTYRGLTLAELEPLVLPPLLAGQFRVAHAATAGPGGSQPPQQGLAYPVALALWARVSPQLDARLSLDPRAAARLRAADWVSGDIPWLMVVAGHPRALPAFLEQLKETEFNGQPLKMLVRGPGAGGRDNRSPAAKAAA